MNQRQWLDELTDRITRLLPQAAQLSQELRTALRQLLEASLSRLNILTREEFDAHSRALDRAEQRIRELEADVAALEKKLEALQQ